MGGAGVSDEVKEVSPNELKSLLKLKDAPDHPDIVESCCLYVCWVGGYSASCWAAIALCRSYGVIN